MRQFIQYTGVLVLAFAFITGCQRETDFITMDPPTVDAGVSQAIQLPAGTVTLSGTASSSNGPIVAYLWSLVSGPNVPVINSPGSATTTISGYVAGTYNFQLMATDDAGLTGVDTTSVTLTAAPIQTLTLRPANNPDERHILGNSSGINQGDSPIEFNAATWTIGGSVVYLRGLFRFDMSAIPAGATILSAKLSLYSNPTPLNGDLINPNSGPNNAFYIQRITSAWNAPTTAWLNQPSSTTADQVSMPHTTQSVLDLEDIDVKNLVTAMHSGNNYGFMIRLQNEAIYNIRCFASSRHSNTAKHPKLVITYQP